MLEQTFDRESTFVNDNTFLTFPQFQLWVSLVFWQSSDIWEFTESLSLSLTPFGLFCILTEQTFQYSAFASHYRLLIFNPHCKQTFQSFLNKLYFWILLLSTHFLLTQFFSSQSWKISFIRKKQILVINSFYSLSYRNFHWVERLWH